MRMNRFGRLATTAVVTSAAMIVVALPASAQTHDIELPPGQGCAFALGIDNVDFPPVRREFTDRNGNPVRLFAGKSGAITYTNLETGASVAFRSRGTHLRETTISPEKQIVEFSGQVGLLLFPTDVPAGPSTTQISGRLVAEFNPTTGFFNVLKLEGNQIDVCARLS